MPKSWSEKFAAPAAAVVKPAPSSIAGMHAGQLMLVPTPRMIAEFMRAVPPGNTVGVLEMRKRLAARYDAEVTCPIYTGYHLRTVAEAALEALARGVPLEAITPFWRVLDPEGPTAGRLPGGADFVRRQRKAEARVRHR